jgi:transcriptional regulator with XRE-family HTH domain
MTSSDIDLGANIRAFRQKRKLSLNELSRITGISASNLSSMELGKSSPTLSTLTKIAAAFDMKAGAFLDLVLYKKAVFCGNGSGRKMETHSKEFSFRVLTAEVHASSMESSVIVLMPQCEPLLPGGRGVDRFLYCLAGEVSATVDEDVYVLREADSLYLLPEAEAELSNRTADQASILMVAQKCRSSGF